MEIDIEKQLADLTGRSSALMTIAEILVLISTEPSIVLRQLSNARERALSTQAAEGQSTFELRALERQASDLDMLITKARQAVEMAARSVGSCSESSDHLQTRP